MKDTTKLLAVVTVPIMKTVFFSTSSAKVRYCMKKNLEQLEAAYDDVQDWLKADQDEFGWEIVNNQYPMSNAEFAARYKAKLDEVIPYTPWTMPERFTEFLDGINGQDELTISFLWKPIKEEAGTKTIEDVVAPEQVQEPAPVAQEIPVGPGPEHSEPNAEAGS